MSFLNKNRAGYIGYYRYSTPEIASGVWNLKQQQQESSNYEWYSQKLYEQDPSNGLNGWTNSGASTSTTGVYTTEGSITVSAVGQYAYVSPLDNAKNFDSLLYTTLSCWVYMPVNNAMEIMFGHTTAGLGNSLKIDTRPTYNTGLMYHSSWSSYGGEPTQGIEIPSSNWTKIGIRLSNATIAAWYIDGVLRDTTIVLKNGNYIGVRKFAGTDTCFLSNLRIYRGPV
jgi:hypothetical protein